jgi:SNF family Na+-dependent transporter
MSVVFQSDYISSNKRLSDLKKIEATEEEIILYNNKLEKFKKALPKIIAVSVVVIFLFPILPGRDGETWLDERDYWSGVVSAAIFSLVIIPVGYLITKNKYKRYIKKLISYKANLEKKV